MVESRGRLRKTAERTIRLTLAATLGDCRGRWGSEREDEGMSGKMREEPGHTEAIIRPSRALLARRARGPCRQRARRARPYRADASKLRWMLFPPMPPRHGACKGSPSSRTRRAGATACRAVRVVALGASRSRPGKWPCGPFNITRGVQSCAVRSQARSAAQPLRFAPRPSGSHNRRYVWRPGRLRRCAEYSRTLHSGS